MATFSVTTDGWTARTGASYVTYTLHFIDDEFILKTYVLGTYEFRSNHTADNLRRHINHIMQHWGLVKVDDVEAAPTPVISVVEETEPDDETMELDDEDPADSNDLDVGSDSEADNERPVDGADLVTPGMISLYMTTDNASNISKAVNECDIVTDNIRCFAHTINLATAKGIEVLEDHVKRVRKVAQFFHKSSKATYLLQVRIINVLI